MSRAQEDNQLAMALIAASARDDVNGVVELLAPLGYGYDPDRLRGLVHSLVILGANILEAWLEDVGASETPTEYMQRLILRNQASLGGAR